MQRRNVWRRTALVIVVLGALLGLTLPNAAQGHVGGTVDHLWVDHIRPRTDARYYTKSQSNARFVNVNEQAADAVHADEADNAETLDGHDSSDFATSTSHNFGFTDECDTAATWNECGVVTIVVPAGASYHVSVWNSGTALGTGADLTALFCAGRRDVDTETSPSCISPFGAQSAVTIQAGVRTAFASSGETTIGPGTWNFSLAFNPTTEVTFDDFGKVVTKVLVRDAGGPVPASALTIRTVEPASAAVR
jgi:hypothetical protein